MLYDWMRVVGRQFFWGYKADGSKACRACLLPQNGVWTAGGMHRCQNQSISLIDTNRNRAQITGLSTFNPFSGENAFQVDTKTRLGSKFLPVIWALFL